MGLKQFGKGLSRIMRAVRRGELLMSLRIDKYFVHVIYTFFLAWLAIWFSMQVNDTLVKVEKNKETITDLKIYHSQKKVQLVGLNRLSTLEELLQKNGSELALPDTPASIIKE